MKQAISSLIVAVGAMLAAAGPTLAHHSRAMFDMTKNVTYRAVVKEYRWQNPHSHIVITVGSDATDRSTVGTWDVEASSISLMVSRGWNRKTYKPGDLITVRAGMAPRSFCSSMQSRRTARGCIARNIGILQKQNRWIERIGALFCRSRRSNSRLACFITAPFRTSRGHRTRTRTATAGTDQIPSSDSPRKLEQTHSRASGAASDMAV
jgi:hypothetical protein